MLSFKQLNELINELKNKEQFKLYTGEESLSWKNIKSVDKGYAKELVEALRKSFEYRDRIVNDYVANRKKGSLLTLTETVRKAMFHYCSATLAPEITRIVKKHVGLNLQVKLFDAGVPRGRYAIEVDIVKPELMEEMEYMEYMTASKGLLRRYKDKQEFLTDISSMYTGDLKLDTEKVKKKYGAYIVWDKILRTTMYFDIPFTYLFEFYYPKDTYGIDPLTPEEVAAIISHEVGHYHTYIERIGHSLLFPISASIATMNMVQHIQSNDSDILDKIIFMSSLLKFIRDVFVFITNENEAIDTDFLNRLEKSIKATDKVNAYVQGMYDTHKESSTFKIGKFEELIGFAVSSFMFIYDILKLSVFIQALKSTFISMKVMLSIIFSFPMFLFNRDKNTGEQLKSSDLPMYIANQYSHETWADDFAVRVGLGAALFSSMEKLNKFSKILKIGISKVAIDHILITKIKFTKSYIFFTKLHILIFGSIYRALSKIIFSFPIGFSHEPTDDRLVSILNSCKQFFRENIDLDSKDEYVLKALSDIEEIEKIIGKRKKYDGKYAFLDKLINFTDHAIDVVTSPISADAWFSLLSKHKYYHDVVKSLNTISNNRMNIYKHKLQNM